MTISILMPALSPTMEEGTLSKWLVKVGDKVSSGDLIAEIETDKATMEVEAVDEGYIIQILHEEGTENIKVNSPIAILSDHKSEQLNISETNEIREENKKTSLFLDNNIIKMPNKKDNTENIDNDDLINNSSITKITVRQALRDAMAEEMRLDNSIFVMGEEVAEYQGAYKVTQGLLQEFGSKRVVDTPITEHGFTGIGVGAAFANLKPIVEFMTFNFAMQAIDQIVNSAAKTLYMSGGQMGCPIVFRGPNGAASRVAAQHSQCFASWYAHIPGLKVLAPWSSEDAKGLLKSAIRDPNPVIFLENEVLYGQSFDCSTSKDFVIPIGKAKIEKQGADISIFAFSIMVGKAMEAAKILKTEGIDVEVINLRSLKPLDKDTIINSVMKTNRALVCEEGFSYSGIASEISSIIHEEAFDWLDAPVNRLCGKDVPMPYAANLEKLALPQIEDIVIKVKEIVT